ncbi:MAG: hypothetical protein SGI72_00115 [Planctomycetota bacterium]|nr:hypothetical protein [Planctomycetota bacterium]
MTAVHDDRHEARLQALLVGDVTRANGEVSRMLAECERCRARLAELERMAGEVDSSAELQRAVLATPRNARQITLEQLVRPTLERLRDESGSSSTRATERPQRSRRWIWLAAALVVAGFFVSRQIARKVRPTDKMLGTSILLVSPGSVLGMMDVFECRFEGSAGTFYEFHVEDRAGKTILVEESDGPLWKPTAEDRARIPREFQWWVRVVDAAGTLPSVDSPVRSSSRLD